MISRVAPGFIVPPMPQILSIDIETYSEVDIRACGAYKYAENCEILLLAYSFDNEPVFVIDLTKEGLPAHIHKALTDKNILKTAYNAAFERACISACYGLNLPPEQWECTLMRSAMAGLPLSLDESAKALNLEQQKDNTGKNLIRYFCMPCKPTKTNGERLRNLPEHDPAKWQAFMNYNMQDVVTEKAVRQALLFLTIPEQEKKLWDLDQRINETGVKIDKTLVTHAVEMDLNFRNKLVNEATKLTGLNNANSIAQLKKWLEEETDSEIESLKKDAIPKLILDTDSEKAKRVLTIRQELSKTSVKKYTAMLNAAGSGDRIRGLLQFYGANRTGRWAGRLVQVQNLPRGTFGSKNLDAARNCVISNDSELLEICFGAIPDTLSQLVRTAFIPEEGKRFIVSDFSAIEARVIAWLAGERWRLEVFNTHGKIYEASAAQMFKVPIESITKSSPFRQKGKIAELALGYQGGNGALIKMGALDMGLTEEELPGIVKAWRDANPAIVQLWWNMDKAAKNAIRSNSVIPIGKGAYFQYKKGYLLMGLPSGRTLCYAKAALGQGSVGEIINYWGVDQTTKKWTKLETYGGKLVENVIQAIARDCLAQALLNVHEAGYRTVMHVHDEIVCELPIGKGSLKELNALLCKPEKWMAGLPLKAEGFEALYYKKD